MHAGEPEARDLGVGRESDAVVLDLDRHAGCRRDDRNEASSTLIDGELKL